MLAVRTPRLDDVALLPLRILLLAHDTTHSRRVPESVRAVSALAPEFLVVETHLDPYLDRIERTCGGRERAPAADARVAVDRAVAAKLLVVVAYPLVPALAGHERKVEEAKVVREAPRFVVEHGADAQAP